MNKIYLLKLLKQFHEADGITSLMKVDDSFISWLKEYQQILLQFKDYYESFGLSIDEWDSYELGKGPLDSVILDKSKSISIYGEEKSELFMFDNSIWHISIEGMKSIGGSDLIYTYNPYDIKDIIQIKKIYSFNQLVAISAIGKNYDKDKLIKIKLLDEQFSDFDAKCNYEESGDNYFYTLYTPRKTKIKILTR